MKDLASIGDTVDISTTKDAVKFSTSGDIGTANVTVRWAAGGMPLRAQLDRSKQFGWATGLAATWAHAACHPLGAGSHRTGICTSKKTLLLHGDSIAVKQVNPNYHNCNFGCCCKAQGLLAAFHALSRPKPRF